MSVDLSMTMSLSDADFLARMKNFEDHLVERKTAKDDKDWKRTAVAFANSVPIGLPAVLYIGVTDDGEIQTPQANLDDIQKRFNTQMKKVYPRVPYVTKIINDEGRQALAVIIPGSESRPHFAGLSYVRRGSENVPASEEQFSELIAQRSSQVSPLGVIAISDEPGTGYRIRKDLIEKLTVRKETLRARA